MAMRTMMKVGQFVELTEMPPPNPQTGLPVPGLRVNMPGVVRQLGHDAEGFPLVAVEFHVGTIWLNTTSVRAVKVSQ